MKEEDQKQNKPITDLELQMNQTKLDKGCCHSCLGLNAGIKICRNHSCPCHETEVEARMRLKAPPFDKQVERGWEKTLEYKFPLLGDNPKKYEELKSFISLLLLNKEEEVVEKVLKEAFKVRRNLKRPVTNLSTPNESSVLRDNNMSVLGFNEGLEKFWEALKQVVKGE